MKIGYCFFFSFLFIISTSAQVIKGQVKNTVSEPLAGVSITLKNTFIGTISDKDGMFQLNVSGITSPILAFNSAGFETIEKVISDPAETEISVVLNKSISSLKEVTVTASRKPEVVDRTPASVQVINVRELQAQATISSSLSSILGYAVPSLGLGSNGTSNTGQTLRGRTPLILIDGIPQSTPLRNGARDMRTIDPSVIQRVEVIKGATAIYGNGADGGIINYITLQPNTVKKFSATTSIAKTGMAIHANETGGFRLNQQINGMTGKFDYALSGIYEKTGVYKDANGIVITPVNSYGETGLINLFSKFGYTLNDKNRIEVMYNYFSSKQNSQYIEQAGQHNINPTIGVKGEVKAIDEGTRYNHNAYVKYLAKGLLLNSSLEASAYMQSFYTVY
ncbi:MAG: TonB-dependent receptor plug domain-containing protein, partial [Chitinophagaceae bacterium]|nr:TonB-dependent receptor plug domain-containing protein [Chitinophagaceae bacterium]